jgi:hypothetical protein
VSEKWGRTGRVELGQVDVNRPDGFFRVYADGAFLGYCTMTAEGDTCYWAFRNSDEVDGFPSLGHAVMYLLRRAAPDVWRAERPVVWRVVRGAASFPVSRWHVHAPRGHQEPVRPWSDACSPEHVDSLASAELANWYADVYARAEYAGTVAR